MMSRASSTASSELSTSHTPSHAMSRMSSEGVRVWTTMSGSAVTLHNSWSMSGDLNSKSPNALG